MTKTTSSKSTKSKPTPKPQSAKATKPVPAPSEPKSKASIIADLLQSGQGATLAELCDATSWQPHSVRAYLSGLRKKGHRITRDRRDDQPCYRIAADGQG